MNSYFFFMFFAFLFYYLFRQFVDKSLPLLPVIKCYTNVDDVINAIVSFVIMLIGGLFGCFIYWIINLFFELP